YLAITRSPFCLGMVKMSRRFYARNEFTTASLVMKDRMYPHTFVHMVVLASIGASVCATQCEHQNQNHPVLEGNARLYLLDAAAWLAVLLFLMLVFPFNP